MCEIHRPPLGAGAVLFGLNPIELRHKSRWTLAARAVTVCGLFCTEEVKETG